VPLWQNSLYGVNSSFKFHTFSSQISYMMKKLLFILSILYGFSLLFAQKDPYLLRNFNKVNSPVLSVSYSPDGVFLLAGYNDGSGRLIRIENENYESTYTGHWKGIQAIEMASSGKFVMTAGDNTIKIWSPEGKELNTFKDHTTTIMTADLDSTGKYIVAGAFNKTFKLMDAIKGGKAEDMRGHTDVVMTVCFNRGGTKIASASGDNQIWIWDFATRQVEMKLNGQVEDIYCLDFSPDGTKLASGSKDKTTIKNS
jgi:WD40 repeat protein